MGRDQIAMRRCVAVRLAGGRVRARRIESQSRSLVLRLCRHAAAWVAVEVGSGRRRRGIPCAGHRCRRLGQRVVRVLGKAHSG